MVLNGNPRTLTFWVGLSLPVAHGIHHERPLMFTCSALAINALCVRDKAAVWLEDFRAKDFSKVRANELLDRLANVAARLPQELLKNCRM